MLLNDNIGFFGEKICGAQCSVKKDNEHKRSEYKFSGPIYDDEIMRKAVNNISNKWNESNYCVVGVNCQDFADALRLEYNKINNSFFNNLPINNRY